MTQPGSWALAMEKNLRQAAEEGDVGKRERERLMEWTRAQLREDPEAPCEMLYQRAREEGIAHVTASSYQTSYYYDARAVVREEMKAGQGEPSSPEIEEAADEAVDQTPREESPSGPEPHEGGTDSVSEEQPEAPSGEPEETGSTPGGEEVCEDPVQESPQPAPGTSASEEEITNVGRPTIHLEADGQRFVAHRNGDGWDLELRVRGVDREIAGDLHDVAFGLLFDRMEETSA